MSFKSFTLLFAGVLLNLVIIYSIVTPVISPYHDDHGCYRCGVGWRAFLPDRANAASIPARMSRSTLRNCELYDAEHAMSFREPTPGEVALADSAIATLMVEVADLPAMKEFTESIIQARRQAVWVDRWLEGGSVLINAYAPVGKDPERAGWVDACTDERWEWSIEFTPGRGGHHIYPLSEWCERRLPPTPSEIRRDKARSRTSYTGASK